MNMIREKRSRQKGRQAEKESKAKRNSVVRPATEIAFIVTERMYEGMNLEKVRNVLKK